MNEDEKNLIKEVEKLIGLNLSPKELANKTPHPKNSNNEKINSTFINQLIVIYNILYRLFYLFIRFQRKVFKIKTIKWQKKLLNSLFVAPNYGAIIFSRKSRNWIDHLVCSYQLTKEQKILLVRSGCINYKKKIFYSNTLYMKIDLMFLLFFSIILWLLFITQTVYLSTIIIIPMKPKAALAIAFILAYFYIIRFIFLMIKAQIWDANELFKKINTY